MTTFEHVDALLIICYLISIACCSTGQKYIYTGSHDGSVYIYDVVLKLPSLLLPSEIYFCELSSKFQTNFVGLIGPDSRSHAHT